MWKKILYQLRLPETDSRSTLAGFHSFCGTVLGLVLVGTEQLNNSEFYFIMAALSLIVVSILNISTPKRRLQYTAIAFAGTVALPRFAEIVTGRSHALSDKIMITLIMWICVAATVEFYPRRAESVGIWAEREKVGGWLFVLLLAMIILMLNPRFGLLPGKR